MECMWGQSEGGRRSGGEERRGDAGVEEVCGKGGCHENCGVGRRGVGRCREGEQIKKGAGAGGWM